MKLCEEMLKKMSNVDKLKIAIFAARSAFWVWIKEYPEDDEVFEAIIHAEDFEYEPDKKYFLSYAHSKANLLEATEIGISESASYAILAVEAAVRASICFIEEDNERLNIQVNRAIYKAIQADPNSKNRILNYGISKK